MHSLPHDSSLYIDILISLDEYVRSLEMNEKEKAPTHVYMYIHHMYMYTHILYMYHEHNDVSVISSVSTNNEVICPLVN